MLFYKNQSIFGATRAFTQQAIPQLPAALQTANAEAISVFSRSAFSIHSIRALEINISLRPLREKTSLT